jgi:LCP family protein required for cell wall assembly
VDTQPIRLSSAGPGKSNIKRFFGILLLALALGGVLFMLVPIRTNILILGTDSRISTDPLGRTDTLIMMTVVPLRPEVGMLSVPRDLWVRLPDGSENRINTAFFFAEANANGSGPQAVIQTIDENFGVAMDGYLLVQFEGIVDVVDAMGGLEMTLEAPMSGYPAGTHTLDGTQALAFVRDRQGSDDFFRIARGQLFLKSVLTQVSKPATWLRLPQIIQVLPRAVQTSLPFWQLPRIGLALFRAGPDGIQSEIITREMVVPFTTEGGASVLNPQWDRIDPVVDQIFGR